MFPFIGELFPTTDFSKINLDWVFEVIDGKATEAANSAAEAVNSVVAIDAKVSQLKKLVTYTYQSKNNPVSSDGVVNVSYFMEYPSGYDTALGVVGYELIFCNQNGVPILGSVPYAAVNQLTINRATRSVNFKGKISNPNSNYNVTIKLAVLFGGTVQ